MVHAFEQETGYRANLSVYGSNEEALATVSSQGDGAERYDVVYPSVTSAAHWMNAGDLLQPLDEDRLPLGNVNRDLLARSADLGALQNGKRVLMPFNWGTEAIAYDSSVLRFGPEGPSYADLWSRDLDQAVVVRARSALMSIGLHLDDTGAMPSNRMRDAYGPEATAAKVFQGCLDFALANKCQIKTFWSDAQSIIRAFRLPGTVIGQVWDGPALRLVTETAGRIRYRMPREGGLAWMDGMGIPVDAPNIDGAYAWMAFMGRADIAALHVASSGYNSCIAAAIDHLAEIPRLRYREVYTDEALQGLWWWPAGSASYAKLRDQAVVRYMAAPAICT
ncbi:MAG: extracellular solute-binding protein [Rhodospirillaceae bacterium]